MIALALLVLTIWVGLALAHARFWQIERTPVPTPPETWPAITVIIPARNEAEGIAETLGSLWRQEYPGALRILLIDDHSEDETVAAARRTGCEYRRESELTILSAPSLPSGWTGKVWAMQQGALHALAAPSPTPYILFSDADISHGPNTLRELVSRSEADACDLVSFMVRLRCETVAERLMIPAFVFFFRLLYPFRRINDPRHPLAGAAGGTMLVRRTALERIGGLECIRGDLIDDCALARQIKRGGHRLWLGLSATSFSTRGYRRLSEILNMIARTAYTQLHYAPLLLLGCVLGLGLTFLAPPILLFAAAGKAAVLGGLAWMLMGLLYMPMVRFYRLSPLWSLLLPVTATLYLAGTLLSAWRHHRGRGGQWKGRHQA